MESEVRVVAIIHVAYEFHAVMGSGRDCYPSQIKMFSCSATF